MKESLLVLSFLLVFIKAHSIEPLTDNQSATDTLYTYDYSSYTIGLDIGTNTAFKGINQNSSQYYFSPNFTYSAESGFFLYSSAYFLYGGSGHWDEFDLCAGYDFNLFKKTQASISYMKSIFSAISPQVNSSLTNNVQFFVKKKVLGIKSKLVFDFYFGSEIDYTISWVNYKKFSMEKVFNPYDDISFTPRIKIIGGTQNFFFRATPKSEPIELSVLQAGIISYVISLPVSYNNENFSIESSFNYSIPGDISLRSPRSYMLLSVYYTL